MESLLLLAFGEEEFFIAFAMACPEAFFNKLLVALPEISNNVGSVKLFMSTLLRSLQRVSLFVSFFGPVDDHGSPVIFRSVSVRPTHLFDPSFRP